MKYCCLIYLLLTANSLFAYNLNDSRIFQECSDNKLFLGSDRKLSINCNDMYHLYLSKVSKQKKTDSVKIAGYNIYKLGSRETKFKSIEINAHLMTQWDVIATTELMPQQGISAFSNRSLNILKKDFLKTTSLKGKELKEELLKKFQENYKKPGYLKLLEKLREIDPDSGWSLILSPYTQSRSFELSGFYFKSSIVKLQRVPYCNLIKDYLKAEGAIQTYKEVADETVYETVKSVLPGKTKYFGCFPKIEKRDAKFMGRLPFMASFKIGTYEFTALTIHARYRENPDDEAKLIEIRHMLDTFHYKGRAIPLIRSRLMAKMIKEKLGEESLLTDEERQREDVQYVLKDPAITPELLQDRKDHQISDTKLVRFYEVYQTARVMKKLTEGNDKNVLMIGDFNLKFDLKERGKVNFWNKITKVFSRSKVYNSSPTSVSEKDKLANDYDHFILRPDQNQNCVAEDSEDTDEMNIKPFDFMEPSSYTNLKFSSWEKLIQPYIKPKSSDKKELISLFEKEVEKISYYKGNTVNTINYAPFSSFKGLFRDCRNDGKKTALDAVSAYIKGYDCSLFHSQNNEEKKWKVFKSLISDHIPLVMTCKID